MPNEVADQDAEETQDDAPEGEAPASTESDEVATLKKRIQGQTGAYNKLKAERDAEKAELEALKRDKAQRERADMSEVEALQRDLAEARQAAEAAEARAARVDLIRRFPLATEFYGDDPLPSEDRLTALEARLAAKSEGAGSETDEQPEPPVDRNTPRRQPPTPPKDRSSAELVRDLATFGNPFRD